MCVPCLCNMAALKAKFSIAAAASPNRKSIVPREQGTAIPRASTIVFDDASKAKRSRVQEEAPVIVSIYKYTDCGGDVWTQLEGTDAPLWQAPI